MQRGITVRIKREMRTTRRAAEADGLLHPGRVEAQRDYSQIYVRLVGGSSVIESVRGEGDQKGRGGKLIRFGPRPSHDGPARSLRVRGLEDESKTYIRQHLH